MRILIFTHSYRPLVNPRAIRWTALAEHWARSEHEVEVVCAWTPVTPRQGILEGVHVQRGEDRDAWAKHLRATVDAQLAGEARG